MAGRMPRVKQVRFQEYLAVGDRNHVCGIYAEISPAWVSMIGKSRQRAAAVFGFIFAARSSRRECR